MNILDQIQQELQELYALPAQPKVKPFCTRPSERQEIFTVQYFPKQEEIAIALSFNANLLSKLKNENPFQSLTLKKLNPFCVAIEGISHFLYFVKKWREGKPLTQLEMEIQAEIDKYLLITWLYYQQQKKFPQLLPLLFDHFSLETNQTQKEKERYVKANQLAQRFCFLLERKFHTYQAWNPLLHQARHFYHLDHWSKMRLLTP